MTDSELKDDYEHEDASLEYVLENVLMPDDGSAEFKALDDEYNSQLIQPCKCSHIEKNLRCADKENCCHGGSYSWTADKAEMVVKSGRFSAINECSDICGCQLIGCSNRRVQFGPRKHLEIFNSPLYKSKGLRTKVRIPAGGFICEYAGELLTSEEANRRLKFNDEHGQMNYILCLNEYAEVEPGLLLQRTIVDPSRRGNIGRYLNHSCQPNCSIWAVRVDSPLPKLGIFAKRDIAANEELCFHYGGEEIEVSNSHLNKSTKICLCAAAHCIGVMPNLQI